MLRRRLLLIVVVCLVILVAVSYIASSRPRELIARWELEKVNSGVCKFEGDPVTAIQFGENSATDETLRHLKSFPHLTLMPSASRGARGAGAR